MTVQTDRSKTTVEELAARSRGELLPLNNQFSYFSVLPIAEEDLRQYLQEPVVSISAAVCKLLPNIGFILVPYIEKVNGKGSPVVSLEPPPESRNLYAMRCEVDRMQFIILAIKDEQVADYHYTLFAEIAMIASTRWTPRIEEEYTRLLREELKLEVHGELDERSWHLKQALLRRQSNVKKESKPFRDYASQSFADTLTLYLHGTCCDIDVETGPRQLPSRCIRRRLELFESLFPPPEGFTVFPEHLKKR